MRSRYLALFMAFLCPSLLHAGNIVVTTNADAGAGSLRSAIETANNNGTATQDVIQFNMPGTAFEDHIINLASELPALTSNIVIDGTTQNGLPFAVTNAKVAIKFDQFAPTFSNIKIENARNVAIYGLYLYIGYWEGIFWSATPIPARSSFLYGINISNSFNIEIGAPGKGNVINGSKFGIYSASDSCRNVRIRSNFISTARYYNQGSNPISGTEIDDVVLGTEIGIHLRNVRDIIIGGETPADGNVLSSKESVQIRSGYTSGNGFVKVQHNLFNKWYDKVTEMEYNPGNVPILYIGYHFDPENDFAVTITDNYINGYVLLTQLTDYFIIQRNHFNHAEGYRNNLTKLSVTQCRAGGLIGSMNAADANLFTNKYDFGTHPLVLADNGPVSVFKNVFTCNYSYGSAIVTYHYATVIPVVQVDNTSSTGVSGRATPNTRVDLYYDDECNACEGEVFIASVTADATGKWQYNGVISGSVIGLATNDKGYSGQFSEPRFDQSNKMVVQPTCNQANGSIKGITGEGAELYYWINLRTGDTASRSLDLIDAPPGEYILYGLHGKSCISSIGQSIILENISPKINVSYAYVNQPACGKFNGSINNVIFNRANFEVKWVNERGEIVGKEDNIEKAGPGRYSLVVRDTSSAGGCSDTATFELINQSGPSLVMSQMQVQPATCFNADGSISNITSQNVTGSESIQWIDSSGNVVGNSFDLKNVPGGRYRLKYKDQSTCDTIVTPDIIVPSPQLDFIKTSRVNAIDGYCGIDKGSIIVESFDRDPSMYSFRWTDKNTGNTIASGTSVSGLKAGQYSLVAEDINGCTKEIYSRQIDIHPNLTIDYLNMKVTHESCSLKNGSIRGIGVKSAQGAVKYNWQQVEGGNVGVNVNLEPVAAGSYIVQVTDEKHCSAESQMIVIENNDVLLPTPVYEDIIIPKETKASLTPKESGGGNYYLYADAAGQQPIQENTSGIFETPVLSGDVVYYIRLQSGSCSSSLVPVKIRVVDKTFFSIPNAFTPNNDGRNDQLVIRVFGHVRLNYFKVFNRYGQEVFSTTEMNDRWDGTVNGKEAQTGTYIWTAVGIDLLGNTIKGTGTITVIR